MVKKYFLGKLLNLIKTFLNKVSRLPDLVLLNSCLSVINFKFTGPERGVLIFLCRNLAEDKLPIFFNLNFDDGLSNSLKSEHISSKHM